MLFSPGSLKSKQIVLPFIFFLSSLVASETEDVSEIRGFTNSITLVEERGGKVILRQSDERVPHRHFARIVKWYQKATDAKITPSLLCCDFSHQILKIQYQEHESWPTYVDCPQVYEETMLVLKKWHHLFPLPRKIRRLQPFTLLEKQYEDLQKIARLPSQLQNIFEELRKIMKKIFEEGKNYAVICHGDFHKGNVLLVREHDTLKPLLIDFDDTGVGHPFYDIAKFTLMLSEEQQMHLLEVYLGKKPTSLEKAHFEIMNACVLLSVSFNRLKKAAERPMDDIGYSLEEMEDLLAHPQLIPSLDAIPFGDERKKARQLGALSALAGLLKKRQTIPFEEAQLLILHKEKGIKSSS